MQCISVYIKDEWQENKRVPLIIVIITYSMFARKRINSIVWLCEQFFFYVQFLLNAFYA
jgi:hypothetical protein